MLRFINKKKMEEVGEKEETICFLLDLDDYRLESIFEYLDYKSFFQFRSCNRRLRQISKKGLRRNQLRQYSDQFGIQETWARVIRLNNVKYLKESTLLFAKYVTCSTIESLIQPQNTVSLTWIYEKIISKRKEKNDRILRLFIDSDILSLVERIYEDGHVSLFEQQARPRFSRHITTQLLDWFEKKHLPYRCPLDPLVFHKHNDTCEKFFYLTFLPLLLEYGLNDAIQWVFSRLTKDEVQREDLLRIAIDHDNSELIDKIYKSYETEDEKTKILERVITQLDTLSSYGHIKTIKWYLEKGGSFFNDINFAQRSRVIKYVCQKGNVECFKLMRDTLKIDINMDNICDALQSGSKDLCVLVKKDTERLYAKQPYEAMMFFFEDDFLPKLINREFLDYIIKEHDCELSIKFIKSKVIPTGDLEMMKMAWARRNDKGFGKRIKGDDLFDYSSTWDEETISWLLDNIIERNILLDTYDSFLRNLKVKPAIILIDHMISKIFKKKNLQPGEISSKKYIWEKPEKETILFTLEPCFSDANIYIVKTLFAKYPALFDIRTLEQRLYKSTENDSLELFEWLLRQRDNLLKDFITDGITNDFYFIYKALEVAISNKSHRIIECILDSHQRTISSFIVCNILQGSVFKSDLLMGCFIHPMLENLLDNLEYITQGDTKLCFIRGSYDPSIHCLKKHEEGPIKTPKHRKLNKQHIKSGIQPVYMGSLGGRGYAPVMLCDRSNIAPNEDQKRYIEEMISQSLSEIYGEELDPTLTPLPYF